MRYFRRSTSDASMVHESVSNGPLHSRHPRESAISLGTDDARRPMPLSSQDKCMNSPPRPIKRRLTYPPHKRQLYLYQIQLEPEKEGFVGLNSLGCTHVMHASADRRSTTRRREDGKLFPHDRSITDVQSSLPALREVAKTVFPTLSKSPPVLIPQYTYYGSTQYSY